MTTREPNKSNEMLLAALEGPDMSPAEAIAVWVMQFLGFLLVVAGAAGGVIAGNEIGEQGLGFLGGVLGLIVGGIGWAFIAGFASIVRNVAMVRRLDVARSIDAVDEGQGDL